MVRIDFLILLIAAIYLFTIIVRYQSEDTETFDPITPTPIVRKLPKNDKLDDETYNRKFNYDYDPNIGLQPESILYDDITKTIMTGSKFLEDTKLIAPPWIAPAWDPSMQGPDINDPDVWKTFDKFNNDERMIYNRCSLSCCANQWPTSMDDADDDMTRIKKQTGEYQTSNYLCSNDAGRTGCICMTDKQVNQ